MTEEKTTKSNSAEQMPEFMRADMGKGTEEWKPEDLAWIGEESLSGVDEVKQYREFRKVSQRIFTPRYVLRLVLREIIKHHPSGDRTLSDGARLDAAMNALLPEEARESSETEVKHASGRKERMDDRLLRVMAREYFQDHYGFSGRRRSLKELCDRALNEEDANWQEMSDQELESARHRLREKFRKNRDRIMIEYADSNDHDARRYVQAADEILSGLAGLDLVFHRAGAEETAPVKSEKQ